MLSIFVLLLTLQVAAEPAAERPPKPESFHPTPASIDFTDRWREQYEKGQDYDYPALNWNKLNVGDAGFCDNKLIYFGHMSTAFRYAEFTYVETMESGEHVIKVTVFTRKAPPQLSTSNPKLVGSLTGVTYPVSSDSYYVLVNGTMPETDPLTPIRFKHDLHVIDVANLPKYGVVPVLEIVTFPPRPTHRAQLGIDVRTWTSADGRHTTEAVYDSFADGKITMTKRDGESITVPIKSLSDADQRWARTKIREELAEKRKQERDTQ